MIAQRTAASVGVALALLLTAACGGSQLSPQDVRAANQKFSLNNSGNGQPIDNTQTVDPGTGQPVAPGQPVPGAAPTTGTVPGSRPGTAPVAPGDSPQGLPGVKPGGCTGFKNQTGITDKTITIGNGSDTSGPVPGLFSAAQQATKAYVAFFNSTSSICGRKLELQTADTRTDAGADQNASAKFCDSAFATVGGMATFDSGGAGVAEACGLPDVRAIGVTAQRNLCKVCFAASATGDKEFSNEVPDFFLRNYKDATRKAAFLYLNVGAAAENGKVQSALAAKRGFNVVYTAPVDVAEFNYGPYVQRLKGMGVEWVQFIGAYQQEVRFAQAMQAANYKPKVFMLDPSAYEKGFLDTGGSAIENTILYVNFTPFEESQPELDRYKQWLQQTSPGANPTFFGLYAWSASKLFVEQAIALGGKLSRPALVERLKGVKNWTGGGSHGPMQVGAKHAPSCIRFLQVKNNKFVPLRGTKFVCGGYSKAG